MTRKKSGRQLSVEFLIGENGRLTAENKDLNESCNRRMHIATVAMRDATRTRAQMIAICTAAASAHHFLAAGYPKVAELVLAAIQAAENDLLNEKLAGPNESEGGGG